MLRTERRQSGLSGTRGWCVGQEWHTLLEALINMHRDTTAVNSDNETDVEGVGARQGVTQVNRGGGGVWGVRPKAVPDAKGLGRGGAVVVGGTVVAGAT